MGRSVPGADQSADRAVKVEPRREPLELAELECFPFRLIEMRQALILRVGRNQASLEPPVGDAGCE